ncbi:acyltransferase [Paenibacillus aceris]|uniref:Acetyltransferase-like isoleucine patch superfamily enzyme n=1 Tax=Paenibacillus aceris TaxID=869555 RepID=A0ABS4HUS6_9BACL|nr:acyltransferase [Paenibacillus aceris]MBP1962310.1 acetyltransferase-like isoleucine patch superfamily enzyme [Paenibacillus aceris]NHW37133.1 acyltransferase [Paenibacillus aceris]
MYELRYFLAKLKYKLLGSNKEIINDYFRKHGMNIGTGTNLCSNIMTPEPYLISIGENVTISNNVQFITHDNSICKVLPNMTDLFGKITIGNNCFLGARSVIMYGVELKHNTIVAAGSVVTKSFNESGIIIGGNPAKKLGNWETFSKKIESYAMNTDSLNEEQKRNLLLISDKLVTR